MPEIVHVFQSGRMNKDLDERLVPNGEYRDALNLDLANSDNGNIGSLQNIQGTIQLRGKEGTGATWTGNFIDAMSNPVCIGSYRDDINERVYWFIASDNISAIAEYDQVANTISPILVDTQNILKFSEQYLITAINIIDKLLFWTDDQTEPKKINIEKFKTGSTDFTTHTKIPLYNQTSETYSTTLTGQPDFIEEDVTVIKKSPLTAPLLDMAASKFGNDIPGTGVTPVTTAYTVTGLENFTYVPDQVTAPGDTESMPPHGVYDDNIATDPTYYQNSNLPSTYGNGIDITVSSSVQGVWVPGVDDIIILKGSRTNENNEAFDYEIRALVIGVSDVTVKIKILSISADILIFTTPIVWEATLEESEPLFEYVFPRFAYRWKYIDNEYSVLSPFTEVAFIGTEFEYVSTDGYNSGMSNNIRKLVIKGLTWGSQEVVELDILYKASNSQAVYTVETIKRIDYTNLNGSLNNSFEITSEIFGSVIQSNQLLRPWDNVPRQAKAQEIIGNRIVYANYLQNYNVPTIAINARPFSQPHPNEDSDNNTNDAQKSIKSIRQYQTGIVFKDKFGRETPVVTDKTAGLEFPIGTSGSINKIQINPTGAAPSWATHYKVFIKDISNEYYNLALDRYYQAEDGNVWISFPSSERNKVTEDSYLILKKQHATPQAVNNLFKYKILSIANEAPTFITRRNKSVARATVEILASSQPQRDAVFFKFDGPSADSNPNFAQGFTSNSSLRISTGSNSTDTYKIQSGGPTGVGDTYSVQLDEPLGNEAFFLNDLGKDDEITIVLFEEEDKILPEYSGRFFVKINRDFGFEQNVIDTFPLISTDYGIKDSFGILPYKSQGPGNGGQFVVWRDFGNTGGSSGNRRPAGNRRPWMYPGEGGDNTKLIIIMQGILKEEASNPAKMLGGVLDPLNKIGTILRFADADGNVGAIYTIKETVRSFDRRGLSKYNDNFKEGTNGRLEWEITLEEPYEDQAIFTDRAGTNPISEIQILEKVLTDDNKTLSSSNPAIFETEPREAVDLDIYYEASDAKPIAEFNNSLTIDYHNVFAFGNGVESNRIRDDFNAVTIDKGVKASSIVDGPYSEERRGSGFIFSQIYNSTSGINRLNQFIQAEPITKDINPIYGTIQKLHARDTDLISLCEDKCLRILANKDALFNADGNSNITSNTNVLGQAVPYAGEYGISKNPESFADYAFRTYFSDKNRGAVIRLSKDGITVISDNGMSDFFADNLRTSNKIIGTYDEDKGIYNITLNKLSSDWQEQLSTGQDYNLTAECDSPIAATGLVSQTTVSFKEEVSGWTSRKSFIPESAISLNNIYYAFKDGLIWEHNTSAIYNNFYGTQYNSSFNVLINELPQIVKGYSALNYTGTESRELEYLYNNKWYSLAEVNANQIVPIAVQTKREGWLVNYIRTNLEAGEIKEFENKEGKYFNYIKALEVCKTGEGVGSPETVVPDPQNYILTITIDEACSSEGGVTPDTFTENLWYLWSKEAVATTNISNLVSNDEVICALDNFYISVNGDYSDITLNGQIFKYLGTDGFVVGTQLYNNSDLTPVTGPLAYVTGPIPNIHPNLDPDNPTPTPNTYNVVLIDASGVISSITQYNTVPDCNAVDPYVPVEGQNARFIARKPTAPYFGLFDETLAEVTSPYVFADVPGGGSGSYVGKVSDNYTYMLVAGVGTREPVYLSTNNGENWQSLGFSAYVGETHMSKSGQTMVIETSDLTVKVSNNFGNIFTTINLNDIITLGTSVGVITRTALSSGGATIIITVRVNGLYPNNPFRILKSTNYGASFSDITDNVGFPFFDQGSVDIQDNLVSGDGKYEIYFNARGVSRYSDDYGQTFVDKAYPQSDWNEKGKISETGQYFIQSSSALPAVYSTDFGVSASLISIPGATQFDSGVSNSGKFSFTTGSNTFPNYDIKFSNDFFNTFISVNYNTANVQTPFILIDVS